jgi:hypothetical protein
MRRPSPGHARTRTEEDVRRSRATGSEPATALSALTFRLVLAGIGAVLWGGGAILLARRGAPVLLVVVAALGAVVALIDLVIVARRKARGERG